MARPVTRRAVLGSLAAGSAAGVAVGTDLLAGRVAASPDPGLPTGGEGQAGSAATVAGWLRSRGPRYLIAHRGSGDVYPEHSAEAYRAALALGARCLEVSVGRTSDGVLICQHDATYDRTTTITGNVADQPSTVLRAARFRLPQLGPAWSASPQPLIPLLTDVLAEVGGRAVLCLEAKSDADYPAVMAAVADAGLQQSVIVKLYSSSPRVAAAQAAGYPVFAYFGAATEVTRSSLATLAARLRAGSDYLVLPLGVDADLVRAAVATGIPVWVYPAHRRVEVAQAQALGVAGVICSSYGYLATDQPVASRDSWASGAIAPGEMTRDPASAAYAPTWSDGTLQLGLAGQQHFLTLGHLGPLPAAAGTYTVSFEAAWIRRPANPADNLTLAFGHADDAYYEHRLGAGSGYHAILRPDGRLELYRHDAGQADGVALASATTPAPVEGVWTALRLQVTPTQLSWTRSDTGGTTVTGRDTRYRGGYLHVGRSSTDGVLALRNLTVG